MHRAFMPHELARALIASDWLDTIHGRDHSRRTVFTILLFTAPRISALASREVSDYLPDARRINFGEGRGKNGRGYGALDATTAGELGAYLESRTDGPLVLTPKGTRLRPERFVYVSCNPISQAKDLSLLAEAFEIEASQPVDLFPHTYHIENVVKLRARKQST